MVKIAPLEGFSQLISDFTGNPHSPVPLPERFFWAEKRYIYKAHINGTSSDVFHSNKTYSSIQLRNPHSPVPEPERFFWAEGKTRYIHLPTPQYQTPSRRPP
jgi:hypothetical protein